MFPIRQIRFSLPGPIYQLSKEAILGLIASSKSKIESPASLQTPG